MTAIGFTAATGSTAQGFPFAITVRDEGFRDGQPPVVALDIDLSAEGTAITSGCALSAFEGPKADSCMPHVLP